MSCESTFGAGAKASWRSQPEHLFHGLVLGMLVDLDGLDYGVRSNPESGLGRLDVAIVPDDATREACVLEFKVASRKGAHALKTCCQEALARIEDRRYDEAIVSRGIERERIHHFGIAFHGKRVLVRHGVRPLPDDAVEHGGTRRNLVAASRLHLPSGLDPLKTIATAQSV